MAVARFAAAHHGVFSISEIRSLGATDRMVQRRLDNGRWERLYEGVYRLAGTTESWRQLMRAACLGYRVMVAASHRSGARVWELDGFSRRRLEISGPRSIHHQRAGVLVHRVGDLEPIDITERHVIPVTTIERTLLDLGGVVQPHLVEEALDEAIIKGLTTPRRVRRRLDALAKRGRPGIKAMRGFLDAREGTDGNPESRFERRLFRLLDAANLPRPVPQYRVRLNGRVVARPDFAYPDLKVAIEADSARHHMSRARFETDRNRRNILTALGWLVLHITWRQLDERPGEVVAIIAAALEAARARVQEAPGAH